MVTCPHCNKMWEGEHKCETQGLQGMRIYSYVRDIGTTVLTTDPEPVEPQHGK
jgi:hypothetical protein